jgi:hypothetical protein
MASLNSASRHLIFVDYRLQNCSRTRLAKMIRSTAEHAFASFLLNSLYLVGAPSSLLKCLLLECWQWASIGSIPVQDLNKLELSLLCLLDFELSISREEYDNTKASLRDLDLATARSFHD